MIKKYVAMLCMLTGLLGAAQAASDAELLSPVPLPTYVSFEVAMQSNCRKSLLAGHRPGSTSLVDADDDFDPSDFAGLGQALREELAEADGQSTEHHLLELGREVVEESVIDQKSKFQQCTQASEAVFRIRWAQLGSHRELYAWVKNYLDQAEEDARSAYISGMHQLNELLARGENAEDRCLEQLRLSRVWLAATDARQEPDDTVMHQVFSALEEALSEHFRVALEEWLAEISKGNAAKTLEDKKYAIGRQLEIVRTAKDQAYYRLQKQSKKR